MSHDAPPRAFQEPLAPQEAAHAQAGRAARRRAFLVWQAPLYAILTAGAVVMLVPLAWLLSSSLKDEASIFLYPPQWIPDPWRWDNYATVFQGVAGVPFLRFVWNTVFV